MFAKIQLTALICICFTILLSCQKTVLLDDVVFDNSLLNKININAENIEIKTSYETKFDEPFIDHVMKILPAKRILSWLNNNFVNYGTENRLVIDIQNASIIKKNIDREINVAGIIKKQNEYFYESNFIVFFTLYNDSNQILATTKTEVLRSTTSSKFISLNERDNILDNLTINSLKDLSDKSVELLKIHMSAYIL